MESRPRHGKGGDGLGLAGDCHSLTKVLAVDVVRNQWIQSYLKVRTSSISQ